MAETPNDATARALSTQGEFVWTEVACNDANKCTEFYKNVFGWSFQEGGAAADGLDYREFHSGGTAPVGGLYQIDPAWFGGNPPPAHILTYIAVDDVDAAAELVTELGGKVNKTMDIPNVGRMSIIEDPTGAMFATFKPNN
jgi:predicted enzyme related to lactoylglutathione lyase